MGGFLESYLLEVQTEIFTDKIYLLWLLQNNLVERGSR